MSVKSLTVTIPSTIWERLDKIEKEQGIKKEDILMRAVVKVIEEFEKKG
ncbi:MAG: hypothetical protein QW332_06100 [Thermoproteota archaeon]